MSSNRMFLLIAKTCNVAAAQNLKCLQTNNEEDVATLWHKRFGHLSYKNLQILQQRNMVKGLPDFKPHTKVCDNCLIGKQHRISFPKRSQWRVSSKLQLVHADLCGPITPPSNSGRRYVLTFIDDYSRKLWVYFLLEKSEAFDFFQVYKNKVEKESGLSICGLRTDRGVEFISTAFQNYCQEHGINR